MAMRSSETTDVAQHVTSGELCLLVMEETGLIRYSLPASGTVSVGRADGSDVRLSDPLASRQHLLLHIGEAIAVEDANSGNGTRVRGELIEPRRPLPIEIGEAIHVGGTVLIVRRAASSSSRPPPDPIAVRFPRGAIVVRDPVMRDLYKMVGRVAAGNINVLVLGETGVGKDVVAETLHHSSPRKQMPLLRLNCAALSESLLESELFGHEQGSFTGATHAKPGLLESANGGTVFLDEVGELPLSIQAKLLRVIEAREVTRVGGLKVRSLDVRFVSATNRNLEQEIRRGRFREDLYFRLNGISLVVPPLRDRMSEIEPLTDMLITEATRELGLAYKPELSSAALQAIRAERWPGNVRELRNAIQRAVLLCGGKRIEREHLPLGKTAADVEPTPASMGDDTLSEKDWGSAPPRDARSDAERQKIVRALEMFVGNQTRAAAYLGIPRRTFVAKLAAHGIPRPRK
ncbi:MAG TPA: sigma 54-interacting transcriptional regulator [Polyangiaceae bacterium]